MKAGWIGFDLDGTLARYDSNMQPTEIGEPIAPMVELARSYLEQGFEVRILTARVSVPEVTPEYLDRVREHLEKHGLGHVSPREHIERWVSQVGDIREAIAAWCETHIGKRLAVTCTKDFGMLALYDDRAFRVIENTGRLCCEA